MPKVSAMPGAPASRADGAKLAAGSSPCGPPPVTRVTSAKASRIAISAATSRPRNRAPRSMFSDPSTWTRAIVTSAHAHHGGATPRYVSAREDTITPYRPYMQACTVL
jgi:hypothetical protein